MKQCATCECEFETPDESNCCPECGSGNWVNGNIGLPEEEPKKEIE